MTWRESHVAGPFDLSIAPDANGLFLGDYHALVSSGATFVPFYVRTNSGNPGNRTDVLAGLVNSSGTAAKAALGAPTRAESAPPWITTPDLERRLQKTARRVLELRKQGHGGIAPDTGE
jgi:hypothetical protein